MYGNRPQQAQIAPQAQQQMALAQALRAGPGPQMGGMPPQAMGQPPMGRPAFTPGAGLPPQAQATLPPQAMGGQRPPMPTMPPQVPMGRGRR